MRSWVTGTSRSRASESIYRSTGRHGSKPETRMELDGKFYFKEYEAW